jgi:hypothetical protein
MQKCELMQPGAGNPSGLACKKGMVGYHPPFDPFPPILLEIKIKLVWFAIRA